jgi:hypothetical protein
VRGVLRSGSFRLCLESRAYPVRQFTKLSSEKDHILADRTYAKRLPETKRM